MHKREAPTGTSFETRLWRSAGRGDLETKMQGPLKDMGDPAVLRRRHAHIGGKEAREAALRRETQIVADVGDASPAAHKFIDRLLHEQGVDIEVWRKPGLRPKQFVEMRTRQARGARHRVKLDVGAERLLHQPHRLAHAKIDGLTRYTAALAQINLTPGLLVAGLNQAAQLAIEGRNALARVNESRNATNLRVKRRRPSKFGAAEPKPGLADAGGEPIGVHVKDEEGRALVVVPGSEVMRLPWVVGDNGLAGRPAGSARHEHPAVIARNMKDEMPFAMRMDVEGTVQLIDHRAAELAVDGRDGPAHLCTSSRSDACFTRRFRVRAVLQERMNRAAFAARSPKTSVLLALRIGPARRPDLDEHVSRIAQGLVHVGDDLDNLADEPALPVIGHFGDEVRADRLAVLIEADLAVRRVDREPGERSLEFRLIVAEVAIDLVERRE